MQNYDAHHDARKGDAISVRVRMLTRRDMPDVMSIERRTYRNTEVWDDDDFDAVRSRRDAVLLVAEFAGHIVGYVCYYKKDGYYYLLNLTVDPSYRRQLIGTQLVSYVHRLSKKRGRTGLVSMVRETNLVGQLFYKAMGFVCTEIVRKAFPNTGESGYTFVHTTANRISPHFTRG
jgi:ribosomal protein S18 acetylase RimI-like enzyme